MPWWVWIAIGVFVLGAAGVVTALIRLAIQIFRALRAGGGAMTGALENLAASGEELDRRTSALSARVETLTSALGRLRVSLDKLSVLNWALGDARDALARLRGATGK